MISSYCSLKNMPVNCVAKLYARFDLFRLHGNQWIEYPPEPSDEAQERE